MIENYPFQKLQINGAYLQLCYNNGTVTNDNQESLLVLSALSVLWAGDKSHSHALCDVGFLPNLIDLLLMRSSIDTVAPEIFTDLQNLTTLGVDGNPVDTMPNPCIPGLLMYISPTALVCDCRLRYLKYHNTGVQDADTPCKEPANLVGVQWGDLKDDNFTCGFGKC